jgi:glycosyltransferase involved in cell wall biosynthesis
MKILLVSPFTSASGSAIRFWGIAQELHNRGFSVVYSDRASVRSLYQVPGITYQPGFSIKPFFLDILFSTLFNIILLFRNLDCEIFYALKPAPNNCLAALIARFFGKKIFLDIDDLDYEYLSPGVKKNLSKFFFHFFPRFFDLITCHTPSLEKFCREILHIHEKNLHYLSQGVSSEFLKIDVSKLPPSPQKSIVYVATLGITSEFGALLPLLAEICHTYPGTKITVVGDGIRKADFVKITSDLKLDKNICFVGKVSHEKLPELMARHRIGLNYMTGSPVNNCRAVLKIREYLACGLDVVCNKSGDADLFAPFIYIEEDLSSMKKRLINLLNTPSARNVSGRNFLEMHYTWESIIKDFLQLLYSRDLIKEKASG